MRIDRRYVIRNGLLATLFVTMSATVPVMAAETAPKRPNLVFVFSDQHSWDMLGCYGNKDIVTPNFDRFAEQGIRFNYCIVNSPLCTPYRGILLSGQHPLYCGAIQNDVQMLSGNGKYFGEVLRDAGYRMGYYGKWHLYGGDRVRPIPPGPYRYGFDHEFLSNNCTLRFSKELAYYWDENGKKTLYGDWEPYAQTRQAMEFIDRHADKPFALFLSWHPPHNWGRAQAGYDAPEDCKALYDPAKIHLRPTCKDTPDHRMKYQGHMAMITSLDRSFGWLMDKLADKGVADNTLVVFTSDHGDLLKSYDWPVHKSRPEDGSCRVPLLIRYPGHLEPGVRDLLIGTFDLMPTILGMMGLPIPDTCQGQNLTEAIRLGHDHAVESVPLFHISASWRGIYTRRYTYSYSLRKADDDNVFKSIRNFNHLYDRKEDPFEMQDLYGVEKYAALQKSLHDKTLRWMKRFGDTGLTWEEIAHKTVEEEAWPAVVDPPGKRPPGWEGKLKGRPIDLLKEINDVK